MQGNTYIFQIKQRMYGRLQVWPTRNRTKGQMCEKHKRGSHFPLKQPSPRDQSEYLKVAMVSKRGIEWCLGLPLATRLLPLFAPFYCSFVCIYLATGGDVQGMLVRRIDISKTSTYGGAVFIAPVRTERTNPLKNSCSF